MPTIAIGSLAVRSTLIELRLQADGEQRQLLGRSFAMRSL